MRSPVRSRGDSKRRSSPRPTRSPRRSRRAHARSPRRSRARAQHRPRSVCVHVSALPKRSKIRSSASCGGYPFAVARLDHDHLALLPGAQLDGIAALRVLDGVLDQGVERGSNRVRIRGQGPDRDVAEAPDAWCELGPAQKDVLQERSQGSARAPSRRGSPPPPRRRRALRAYAAQTYPTFRTVSIGASGPSFLRSRLTHTSTMFERGSKS